MGDRHVGTRRLDGRICLHSMGDWELERLKMAQAILGGVFIAVMVHATTRTLPAADGGQQTALHHMTTLVAGASRASFVVDLEVLA